MVPGGRLPALLLAALALLLVAGCTVEREPVGTREPLSASPSGPSASGGSPSIARGSPSTSVGSPSASGGFPSAAATSGVPDWHGGVIARRDLPPEALETLRLIDRGGPFPYRQDGGTFFNRERHLPPRPSGYYREYTVETPGSSDRGPRRIVTGAGGEAYYTSDHYATFRLILDP